MNGVANLTPQQAAILNEFREKVKGLCVESPGDAYLLKWLKARNFDIRKAETMLRNSIAWRKETAADTLIETYEIPEVIRKYYPGGVFGCDKEGHPILIYPLGQLDARGMIRAAKKSDVMKSMIVRNEQLRKLMEEKSKQEGRVINQCVQILDFENFSTKHLYRPAIQMYLEILRMLEDNYPEMLYRSYIVRAPKAFHIAYGLVKRFLSEDTIKKFQILGQDWKERLTKDISPDQLPVHWGGKCVDKNRDQACRSHVCMGGEIPKSYYLKEQIISDTETYTHTTIKRKSFLNLEFNVPEEGLVLRWQFLTKGQIGFGVYLKSGDGKQRLKDMLALEPLKKYNCQYTPEDGVHLCEIPGKYILRFDNSHAKLHKKQLSYFVEMIKPGTETITSEVVQGTEEQEENEGTDSTEDIPAASAK